VTTTRTPADGGDEGRRGTSADAPRPPRRTGGRRARRRRRREGETATAADRSGSDSGRPSRVGNRPNGTADTGDDGGRRPADDLPSETRANTATRSDRSETTDLRAAFTRSLSLYTILILKKRTHHTSHLTSSKLNSVRCDWSHPRQSGSLHAYDPFAVAATNNSIAPTLDEMRSNEIKVR